MSPEFGPNSMYSISRIKCRRTKITRHFRVRQLFVGTYRTPFCHLYLDLFPETVELSQEVQFIPRMRTKFLIRLMLLQEFGDVINTRKSPIVKYQNAASRSSRSA